MPELGPHYHCPECGISLEAPEPDGLIATLCPRAHEIRCPPGSELLHRCERCLTAFPLLGSSSGSLREAPNPEPPRRAVINAPSAVPERPKQVAPGGVEV